MLKLLICNDPQTVKDMAIDGNYDGKRLPLECEFALAAVWVETAKALAEKRGFVVEFKATWPMGKDDSTPFSPLFLIADENMGDTLYSEAKDIYHEARDFLMELVIPRLQSWNSPWGANRAWAKKRTAKKRKGKKRK